MMKTTSSKKLTAKQRGLVHGYRSGLEESVAEDLTSKGVGFSFEQTKIKYTKPERQATYTPDFVLENGIIVETKGRFLTADRQKHLLVQKQHPELDIRFVFSRPQDRISKQSSTTYAMWCAKNGFKYAAKTIPQDWLNERKA